MHSNYISVFHSSIILLSQFLILFAYLLALYKSPIYQKRKDEQRRPSFFLRNKIRIPTRLGNLLRALLVYMRRVRLNVAAGTPGLFCLEEGMVGLGRELFCFAVQEGRTCVLELTRSGFGAFAVCGFFSVLGLKLTAF
jgi:amino acid transporter